MLNLHHLPPRHQLRVLKRAPDVIHRRKREPTALELLEPVGGWVGRQGREEDGDEGGAVRDARGVGGVEGVGGEGGEGEAGAEFGKLAVCE